MAISKFLDPQNDIAFKRIFGSEKNKDILIHFINDIQELSGKDAVVSLDFLNTCQEPTIAGSKQSILDVLCKDSKGVQFIVEMQVGPPKGFEKRAQYYASKAYSSQMLKGQEEEGLYENLKEVVFIAILNRTMFPKKAEYKSTHVILDKRSGERDLKDFSFTFIELSKFKKEKVENLVTLEEKWCYFFKNAKSTTPEALKEIIKNAQVIERAYEELISFNWTEEELRYYESTQKRIWDDRAIKAYIKEEGILIGKAEGMKLGEKKGKTEGMKLGEKKGKAEGMKLGEKKEKHTIAKKLLQQGLDIKTIAQATNLTIGEIKKLQ